MDYERDELIHAAVYCANKEKMNDELYHHGILGQKWGIRRFQNEDGSLTKEGERRYGSIGKHLTDDQKKALGNAKRELVKLKQDAIDQQEWSAATKRFVDVSQKNYDKTLAKYGENHKKTKRAEGVLTAAELIDEVQSKTRDNSLESYKKAVKDTISEYGNKRITDMKHFATTKLGEEYVKGFSGYFRDLSAETDWKTGNTRIRKHAISYGAPMYDPHYGWQKLTGV